MLLTDVLLANCWKEQAVWLREKAGLSVPECRQTVMKDEKTYFYKLVIVVCKKELKLADYEIYSGIDLLLHVRNRMQKNMCFGGRTCYDMGMRREPLKDSKVSRKNDIHGIATWAVKRPRIHISMHVNTFI